MNNKQLLIAIAAVVIAVIFVWTLKDRETYYVKDTCLYAIGVLKNEAYQVSGNMLRWWTGFLQRAGLQEPDIVDNAPLTTALGELRELSQTKTPTDDDAKDLYQDLAASVVNTVEILRNHTSGTMTLNDGHHHEDLMKFHAYKKQIKDLRKALLKDTHARAQCIALTL